MGFHKAYKVSSVFRGALGHKERGRFGGGRQVTENYRRQGAHFEFSGLGSWCVGFLVGRSRIFSTADKWEIRDLKIDPC